MSTITRTRWWRNGDHPLDYVGDLTVPDSEGPLEVDGVRYATFTADFRREHGWEGGVVRYFRHPAVDGAAIHPECGRSWDEHGWIDQGLSGLDVCPGDWVVDFGEVYGVEKPYPNE